MLKFKIIICDDTGNTPIIHTFHVVPQACAEIQSLGVYGYSVRKNH